MFLFFKCKDLTVDYFNVKNIATYRLSAKSYKQDPFNQICICRNVFKRKVKSQHLDYRTYCTAEKDITGLSVYFGCRPSNH